MALLVEKMLCVITFEDSGKVQKDCDHTVEIAITN